MPVISGLLLTLSFPKFDLFMLAWFALVPLLYSLYRSNFRSALVQGLVTGLVFNMTAFHWFFSHFLIRYSSLAWPVSLIIFFLVGLYLALYYSAFAGFIVLVRDRLNTPIHISAPFAFLTLEFIRAKALTGFPWELLGYSQYRFLQMIQIADITGVYGISFLIVFFNSAVTLLLKERFRITPAVRMTSLTITVLLAASLTYGYWRLSADPGGEKIRVSLIQGNIPIEDKLSKDMEVQKGIIDIYGRMTAEAVKENPDLIVWPETAMPFIFGLHKESSESLLDYQKRMGVPLITGIVVLDRGRYTNAAVFIREGKVEGIYSKIKLVPFGEYNPFGGKGKLISNLDYSPGRSFTVFDLNGKGLSVLICYEIIFPDIVRAFVISGARTLLAISNDTWFGDSAAPYQHFSMAVFRAVENRVPLLRVANTGVSGVIDSNGRIEKVTETFVTDIITADISVPLSNSPYSRYGDIFCYLMISVGGLWVLYSLCRRGMIKNFS